MASFPPFKKSLFRIITVIAIICLLVISCTIPASAFSDDEFPNKSDFPSVNVPISRPQLDGKTVYAEVLTKYGNGLDYRVLIYIFTVTSIEANHFTCTPKITDGNHIDFEFWYKVDDTVSFTNDFPVVVTSYYYDSDSGFLRFKDSYGSNYDYDYCRITTTQNYGIYGVHYYGMDFTGNAVPSVQKEFVVNYASEGLVLNYLEYFKDTFSRSLTSLNSSISSLITKFDDFGSQCLSYLYANISHLTNMEIYLEMLTEQNNQMINGPPGSDEEEDPPPEEVAPPRNDSTVDDIKEAEKDAVGGKTDEEIKEDIKDTLDFEDKKDEVNGEEIETSDIEVSHNTFNLVFDFMGGAWNSYFILSLTIAFAAFLIGRRY